MLKTLETVRAAYSVDDQNIFLAGFSQGAYLAFWTGFRHPGVFRGTVSIAGWANAGDFTAEETAAAKGPGARLPLSGGPRGGPRRRGRLLRPSWRSGVAAQRSSVTLAATSSLQSWQEMSGIG